MNTERNVQKKLIMLYKMYNVNCTFYVSIKMNTEGNVQKKLIVLYIICETMMLLYTVA